MSAQARAESISVAKGGQRLEVGAQVWVKAKVVHVDEAGKVKLVSKSGEVTEEPNADNLYQCNTAVWKQGDGLTGVDDLSTLTHLHEPEVLEALQLRFDVDKIYTFCGPILIALNPFKGIPGLYNMAMGDEPKNGAPLPPHVYAISGKASRALARNKKSQTVLISGESGAGKTETMKHVLKLLTTTVKSKDPPPPPTDGKPVMGTEMKVLNSNGVLEAFGNACTVRNKNSSRFGKFIGLEFEMGSGNVPPVFACAAIDSYLLEKVRLTEVGKRERTYHIFYQCCQILQKRGADYKDLPWKYFGKVEEFTYLTKSDRLEIENVDDTKVWDETDESCDCIGMTHEEQVCMIKAVAAVLHIGNIVIGSVDKEECKLEDKSAKHMDIISELLGISKEFLTKAFTKKQTTVGTEKFESPVPQKKGEELRESFSRSVYAFIFTWVVKKVNDSLKDADSGAPTRQFIGVLDIFGFEHFETNSFEQLCINFANERLQQLFNHFVFNSEMETYKKEGVPCDNIEFTDNGDIIDLIAGKGSILSMLDEECRLPKGSDTSYAGKLAKTFEKHKRFKFIPRQPSNFTVLHFAGPVNYSALNFMDKNVDEMGDLMKGALESSTDKFLHEIVDLQKKTLEEAQAKIEAATGKAGGAKKGAKKPMTVATDFKGQLDALMTKMKSAEPHFIRCLKPNPQNVPDRTNRQTIVDQLRSGGVIEALKVQRAGYPCRSPHDTCWSDIKLLFKSKRRAELEGKPVDVRLKEGIAELAAEMGFSPVPGQAFAIGTTTAFFKQEAFERVDCARLGLQNGAARSIQGAWFRHLFYGMFKSIRELCIKCQSFIRRYLVRIKIYRAMRPKQRRVTKLFKNVPPEDCIDSEEEREKAREAERLAKEAEEQAAKEEAHRIWLIENADRLAREEEERIAREMEEERIRLEKEQAERDRELMLQEQERLRLEAEAEQKRLEEEREAAIREERRRMEEQRRLEEEARLEAERKLAEELEEERRRQAQEMAEAAEKEEALRKKMEAELEAHKQEMEVRMAEMEQQAELQQLKDAGLKEEKEQLLMENERLKNNSGDDVCKLQERIKELDDQHSSALETSKKQLEEQRESFATKMEEMRKSLAEQAEAREGSLKNDESSQGARYDEELERLRKKEEEQRQKYQREVMETQQREASNQRQWQDEVMKGLKDQSDLDLQNKALEQKLRDQKAEHDHKISMLQNQISEHKRISDFENDLQKHRFEEKQRSWELEIEMCRQQRDDQLDTLRTQLEFQKQELQETAAQEVELVRRQYEQHLRSLQQMLDQSRSVGETKQKQMDMQLNMKMKQQEELYRTAEQKAKQLEETAKRQQELMEQHIEQLNQQMEIQTQQFHQQLEEAEIAKDERHQSSVRKVEQLEKDLKKERSHLIEVMREHVEKCEKDARDWSEVQRTADRMPMLEMELKQLKRKLDTANADLLESKAAVRKRNRQSIAALDFSIDAGRRHSDTALTAAKKNVISAVAGANAGEAIRRPTMRMALAPPEMVDRRRTMAIASPAAQNTKRSSLLAKANASLKALQSAHPQRDAGPQAPTAATKDNRLRLLRATMKVNGKPATGEVRVWKDLVVAASSGRQSDAAVTALAFAEARREANYFHLAAACKFGTVFVFQVPRTALERGIEDPKDNEEAPFDPEPKVKIQAHTKAVTDMCFGQGAAGEGTFLVTSSSDWTARCWSLKDGSLIRQIDDSSMVVCIVPIPKPIGAFVLANAGAVLRLVELDGKQQKVRLDHYARALRVGLGGKRLLAATSKGWVHALDVGGEEGLQLVSKNQVAHVALTSLALATSSDGMPPLLVANAMDSLVCIMQANQNLTNFTVLRRVPNPHRVLPLRCCHISGNDGSIGFVAAGSEDSVVRVYDLDDFTEMRLDAHTAPVIDVAVTGGCGLLATGDAHGCIKLWRQGVKKKRARSSSRGKSGSLSP